jgi:hypothetical protein
MARPAIIHDWEKEIFEILADDETVSAGKIRAAILKLVRSGLTKKAVPSQRTIGRIKERWRDLPSQRQLLYRQFHWPESMGSDQLPWEASAAVLELLSWLRETSDAEAWQRPDTGLVTWYWRATLAAPNAPTNIRVQAARHLLAWEILGERSRLDALEWFLAFKGWAEGGKARYQQEVDRSRAAAIDPFNRWYSEAFGIPAGEYEKDQLEAGLRIALSEISEDAVKYIASAMRQKMEGTAQD